MSTLHNRGPPAGPCGAAELHELSQYHYQTQTQRVSRISPERVSRISPVAHVPRRDDDLLADALATFIGL